MGDTYCFKFLNSRRAQIKKLSLQDTVLITYVQWLLSIRDSFRLLRRLKRNRNVACFQLGNIHIEDEPSYLPAVSQSPDPKCPNGSLNSLFLQLPIFTSFCLCLSVWSFSCFPGGCGELGKAVSATGMAGCGRLRKRVLTLLHNA